MSIVMWREILVRKSRLEYTLQGNFFSDSFFLKVEWIKMTTWFALSGFIIIWGWKSFLKGVSHYSWFRHEVAKSAQVLRIHFRYIYIRSMLKAGSIISTILKLPYFCFFTRLQLFCSHNSPS